MTKIVEQVATYLSEYNSNIRHVSFVLRENWVLVLKYPGSSAGERCFEMVSATSGLLRTKAGLVTCK